MGVGVVEEVALDAPGFVEDLLPLGAGVDDGFKRAKVEGLAGTSLAGLQVVGRRDCPSALAGVEDFGAIEGDLEGVEIAEDRFGLALFQREAPDGANARAAAIAAGAADG